MRTPRIIHSKKAISPILATLLLVVIAVSAIVVTYAWMTTYIDNTTSQASAMPYKANVAFTSKTITIDIGNSGTADTEIIKVYIGLSESTATSQTPKQALPIVLRAGEISSFTVTYTWAAGETYYFNIVTASSQASLTFQEQAPQ